MTYWPRYVESTRTLCRINPPAGMIRHFEEHFLNAFISMVTEYASKLFIKPVSQEFAEYAHIKYFVVR